MKISQQIKKILQIKVKNFRNNLNRMEYKNTYQKNNIVVYPKSPKKKKNHTTAQKKIHHIIRIPDQYLGIEMVCWDKLITMIGEGTSKSYWINITKGKRMKKGESDINKR